MDLSLQDLTTLLERCSTPTCLVNADHTLVYENAALRALGDASILAEPGPVRIGGTLYTVTHQQLSSGRTARIATPETSAASAELEVRSGMLNALVEAAPVAILVLDLQMRVTMWNPACERIFGWTEADVLGEPYPLVPAHEWDRFESFFATVVGGQGFTAVEAERARKDGQRIHTTISTAPIRGGHGEVIGAMAILEDITERKLLEARYHQAAKLEAVGRLAGGIAHDFNNALTVILAYSDMLALNASPVEVNQSANAIRRSAERAAELTRQLLAFSRRQVLQARNFDLNETLRESLDMLQRLIGADVEVETKLHRAPLWVRADPAQIERLLMNLAVNARDAMPDGGTLTLSSKRLTRQTPTGARTWVQLTVEDTGEGMDAETAARVFEPFFTTKPVGKGTGLGLASVYGIVRQSGGEVDVVSELDRGTTFRVLLPEAKPAKDEATEEVEEALPVRRATVLVAEDDAQVRMVVCQGLRMAGHTVLEATDGIDALEVAKAYPDTIDLLFTDVVMPRMGGGALATALTEARPTINVIFASGHADDEVVRRGVEKGAHFVQKPFSVAAMVDKIQQVLEG
ncbi:MAG: PAS domain S-box protein [Proteobacteria bacterium]|nr:PAS domain S-box protein [Pseudomonadota bacterium]